MIKKLLLLILPVACYLSPVTLFAQSTTLKVCMNPTSSPCKLATIPFLSYSDSTVGSYTYNPQGASSLSGGLTHAPTWQWNTTGTSSSAGAFTNTKPYVSGRHICSSSPSVASTPSLNSGRNCWCQITHINGVECSDGPWVFFYAYDMDIDCRNPSNCANYCGVCAQFGSHRSCRRSALLALP